MKGEFNIDEIFHQRLHNAEVLPPIEVWPKIEDELRQKRRRRFFFWFWFVGLGAFGAGVWNLASDQALSHAAQTTKTIPTTTTNGARATATAAGAAHSSTAALAAAEEDGSARLLPPNHKTADLSVQNTAKGITPDPGIGMLLSVKPLPLPGSAQALSETSPLPPGETGKIFGKSQLEPDFESTSGAKPIIARNDPFFGLPSLDFVSLESALKQPLTKTARIIKKKKEQKKCFDFHKNSTAWFVDAYAGPSLVQKMLSTTPDNLPYLNKRLNSERRDWATFNMGLRATYVFKHNFLLRTGLHYDHSTEVFTFKELKYKETITHLDTVTGQLDTIDQRDVFNYYNTFNRFGMLEIPVMGGFELRSGNMGININAGVSFNVLFWKRGKILSPDDKSSWFTPSRHELEVFRPRTGMSVMGSAQWFWHLQPRLRIYVEPYFRQVLKPINVSAHPIEQRHRVWGLNLGVTRILD